MGRMFRYLFKKPGSPPEALPGSRLYSSHRNSPVLAILAVLSMADDPQSLEASLPCTNTTPTA